MTEQQQLRAIRDHAVYLHRSKTAQVPPPPDWRPDAMRVIACSGHGGCLVNDIRYSLISKGHVVGRQSLSGWLSAMRKQDILKCERDGTRNYWVVA